MLKVYGSKNCPDCRNLKLNFLKYGIEFEEIEILDSLKNLKEFLHYRDNNKEVFDRLIQIGDIGIPCIIDGNHVFTDWESYLIELGHKDLIYEDSFKSSCSINGKGC